MKKRTKKEIKRCLTGIVTASLIISSVHIGTFALAAKKTSIAKSAKVTVGKTVRVKLKNNKKSVKWKVSKGTKYVKITKKSKTGCTVKGLKKGLATVQAVIGKKKYSCKITVAAKKTAKKTTKKPATTKKPVATAEPTATTKPTASSDVTVKPEVTGTPAVTDVPSGTNVPTSTPAGTNAPTVTETPTVAPVVTDAPTVAPTNKAEPKVTPAPTITPTLTPTVKPTAKPTRKPGEIETFYYDGSLDLDGYDGLYNVVVTDDVTEIPDEEFEWCTNMVKITISKSVKKIGVNAFKSCSNLSSIVVDDENAYFDSRNNCNAIISKSSNKLIVGCKNTVIPNGIKSIGDGAFDSNSSLKEITIPDSVTEIGASAFSYCTNLEKINMPANLEKIGESAFSECARLLEIKIPDSVTEIGSNAFYDCAGLSEINIPSGLKKINQETYAYCSGLKKITIPDSVTQIGYNAFRECIGLSEISIPKGMSEIPENMYYGCTGLTSITIPEHITTIKEGAFDSCTNLQEVKFHDKLSIIENNSFSNCPLLKSIEIPASVTVVESQAFAYNDLDSIVVDEGNKNYYSDNSNAIITVKAMEYLKSGSDWFSHTYSANEIVVGCKNTTVSAKVKSIGEWAFCGCVGLTNIEIPEGVETIKYDAFQYCRELKKINIPASVTDIGLWALAACDALEEITVDENNQNYDSRNNCNAIISKKALKVDNYWKYPAENMIAGCKNTVIPEDIAGIAEGSFYDLRSLESITVPDKMEGYSSNNANNYRNTNLFPQCNNLKSITWRGKEYKRLDEFNSAFQDNKNLNMSNPLTFIYNGKNGEQMDNDKYENNAINLEIANGVEDLFYFAENDRIVKVSMADSVKKIEDRVFQYCHNLSEIQLSKNLESIEEEAFYECTSLKKISIPEKVTEIQDRTFYGCRSLEEVELPYSGNLKKIGDFAFSDCESLNKINIPEGVTDIGNMAFADTALTEITIPDSITNISYDIFQGCENLTSIIWKGQTYNSASEFFGAFKTAYLEKNTK